MIDLAGSAETKERVYHIEIPIIARLTVTAENKTDAEAMAAELLGAGRRAQAVTGDGIPFTTQVSKSY